MRTVEIGKGKWIFFKNSDAQKRSNGKLHVAIPVIHFDDYQAKIYDILSNAVRQGIIPSFKMLQATSQGLREDLGNEELTIHENGNARLYNNPFTIYLEPFLNLDAMEKLFRELEQALKNIAGCNNDFLSIADLPLTKHISYRIETINDQYIKIAIATPEQLVCLQKLGEQSQQYIHLKTKLNIELSTTEMEQSFNTHDELEASNQRKSKLFCSFFNSVKQLETEYNATLAATFLSIKQQTEEAGFLWTSFITQQKGSILSLESHLYHLMYAVINIKFRFAFEKKFASFHYVFKEDLLTSLEQLYLVYHCIQIPDEFYKKFLKCLSYTEADLKSFPLEFKKDLVQTLLQDYFDQELSIFLTEKIKTGGRKNLLFANDAKMKILDELYIAYQRLNQEKLFLTKIVQSYPTLVENELTYRQLLSKNNKSISNPLFDCHRPLIKYISLRQYTKEKNAILEKLALQLELFKIFYCQFNKLQALNNILLESKQITELHTAITSQFSHQQPWSSAQEIDNQTSLLLSLIADFINHGPKTQVNTLLSILKTSHILKEYLQLDNDHGKNKNNINHLVQAKQLSIAQNQQSSACTI